MAARAPDPTITTLCRDCGAVGWDLTASRCAACRSPRLLAHAELGRLSVAHVDCDAFYASVEKRDRPELAERPLIIGGGRRGVVATACYVARLSGVRSAMPMFKALRACPDAVVLKPDMAKYVAVSREIRARMEALTPLVEPLSLDEAFLDLTGCARLHGMTAAEALARLARDIDAEIGVSVSIGLAPNKFLAKIASELDKPRGFAVIGAAEAAAFLAPRPVSVIWGVGPKFAETLRRDGFATIGDLRRVEASELFRRYGAIGGRLARLAWGEDARAVTPDAPRKSVSAERTFEQDIDDADTLDGLLWRLCEDVSARLKSAELEGRVVSVKLKTAAFRILTRRIALSRPTALADALYQAAAPLLESGRREAGAPLRLLGVGASDLSTAAAATPEPDLFAGSDPAPKRAQAEHALDEIRSRFGDRAILKGRALKTGSGKPE